MITTAVVPVAGKGTRLLPFTKEIPKEMLPLYHKSGMKPIVQIIFEQLYDSGIRNFIFIVGVGKRAIEDHFTPDSNYIKMLQQNNKDGISNLMSEFYSKIDKSKIAWVNQAEPRGFGDAVLKSEPYINEESFIVHAGDACMIGYEPKNIVQRVCDIFEKHRADGAIATKIIKDKESLQLYGIVTLKDEQIVKIIEKPKNPESNVAVMPIYAFNASIFESLKQIKPGHGNEIQLTDGIASLISSGQRFFSCPTNDDMRFDVGTPELYLEALKYSFTI